MENGDKGKKALVESRAGMVGDGSWTQGNFVALLAGVLTMCVAWMVFRFR